MIFIICRASGNTPPCDGAIPNKVKFTFSEKCTSGVVPQWLQKNHPDYYIEDGCFKWDVCLDRWTIEINSLEELIALQERVGDLILGSNWHVPSIKIYDDYME